MSNKSKTYYIRTFGCQANEADSERIAGVLKEKGYRLAKNIESADLVVINSCSVRESAENRVFGLVNKLQKLSPKRRSASGRKIVLTGCMVGSAKRTPHRYTLNQLKVRLPWGVELKLIEEIVGNSQSAGWRTTRNPKTIALVPIMEGCSHFCSYCVVPYARGIEKSRNFQEIVCEVEELVKRGSRQIMLLGQNVNFYQPSFAKLLMGLNKISGLEKISFMTSNPWDLTNEIIKAMSLPKIDRYLHLPVQSGDDEILKKMNRPYTAKLYLDLIKRIRKMIPDITIGTDIIVGFPCENTKQFENTVQLCQKAGFVKAYVSRYSPRPGTAAFKLKDDVAPAEKRRRWRILEELINK
jgi:tRNA-2-methylthio-N6-dimethylallyladenosine synthase